MAVIDRVSADSVLMPYRGWGYPDTSGVSAAERLLITWMYAGIATVSLASLQKGTSVTPYVRVDWYSRYTGITNSTGGTAYKLKDDEATFQTWGVQAGWTVKNRSTGATATVVSVDSETQLTEDSNIISGSSEFYTVYSDFTRIDNLSSVQRIGYPLGVDLTIEPYNIEATIELNNSDSAFDAYSLDDKWIRIGFGIDDLIDYKPYMKVVGQDFISSESKDTYILYCQGAPNILNSYIAYNDNVPTGCFYFNQPSLDATLDGMTARDIADYILELAGLDLGADISLDANIDSWEPEYTIYANTIGLEAMDLLLGPFQCSLLARTDNMHLLTGNTGNSYTYKVPQDASYQAFTQGRKRQLSYKPQKVKVLTYDEGTSGEYAASSWSSDMGVSTYKDQYNMASTDDDCIFIATSYVTRAANRAVSGVITLPIMNCLTELYDLSSTIDGRGNTTMSNGLVGGLYYHYYPGSAEEEVDTIFTMEVRIGGFQKDMPTDIESLVDQLNVAGITSIKDGTTELDYIKDGKSYSKTLATDVDDGHLKLTSNTVIDGKWYSESGVEIDADNGIDCYGEDMAFTTSKLVGTSITSVASSDSGTTITCTTASAHGLTTGDQVVLRGMSVSAYNGKYTCTVIDADEFKVTVAYSATATGYAYQVQCSVDSDGAITAGSGGIALDNTGLIINDNNDDTQYILFKYNGNLKGALYRTSGDAMFLSAATDVIISALSGRISLVPVGGEFVITNLPGSDPGIVGAVYNDSGTLKISAG